MAWFAGGFLLALRVVGAGWVWTAAGGAFIPRLGRTLIAGLLLNLLPALVLASFGRWTPGLDWAAWAAVAVIGLVRWRRGGAAAAPEAKGFAAALAVVALLAAVPLAAPPRSEWLAGGWDPGIYQNNAVAIARANGFQGRAESVYSRMPLEDRPLFTRSDAEYHEVFPGAPIRLADGSLPLYFFHLSPLCGAWFWRAGGLDALLRMPAVLALWGLLPMLALAGLAGWRGWRLGAALGAWLLSPMWWYQQSLPTSEMLYLLLLLGGILLYLREADRGAAVPAGAMAALFAATANHLNAALLAGILLLVAAAAEAAARAPRRVVRIALCFAALGAGIAWDLGFAGITILRLEEKDQALRVILPAFAALALLGTLLAWRPLPAAVRARGLRWLAAGGGLAGLALAALALGTAVEPVRLALMKAADRLPVAGPVLERVLRVVPFHGPLGWAWACAGLAGLSLRRDPALRLWKALAFALALVCLLLFVEPGIAPLYPWALRRYVVFLVPLLAWGQAFAAVRGIEEIRARGGGWRWAALLILAPAVVEGARLAAAAGRVGDYPGLARTLAALEQALQPGDVVIADDPEWGTPLLLAGGRDVVSGRRLWRSEDPGFQRRYLDALARARRETGRRFLWMTSTGDRLDLYPVELGVAPAPLAEIAYAFHTVNHGERGRTYEVRERQRVFRLYEWDGTYRPRAAPAP